MKIHAIQTGTVAITTKWREGVGHGRLRLVHTLLDREWTEPLPIYAFAIEHPEGVIVVDTGETARASQHGYFPGWGPGGRRFKSCLPDLQKACKSGTSSETSDGLIALTDAYWTTNFGRPCRNRRRERGRRGAGRWPLGRVHDPTCGANDPHVAQAIVRGWRAASGTASRRHSGRMPSASAQL